MAELMFQHQDEEKVGYVKPAGTYLALALE